MRFTMKPQYGVVSLRFALLRDEHRYQTGLSNATNAPNDYRTKVPASFSLEMFRHGPELNVSAYKVRWGRWQTLKERQVDRTLLL